VAGCVLAAVCGTAPLVSAAEPAGRREVPLLTTWEANMVKYGTQHGTRLAASQDGPLDPALAATYYDAQRVYLQIADYTRDEKYLKFARAAEHVYRDRYVFRHEGAVAGYWNFTEGLTRDFLRERDERSREAVLLLSRRAMYAADDTPLDWTADVSRSREVAYAIMSYVNAQRVGAPRRERLRALVRQAQGHVENEFTREVPAPFMFALSAESLILYDEHVEADPALVDRLARAADATWQQAWLPRSEAFYYSREEGRKPAPDLNLLIAPVYAWLYLRTGQTRFRDRGDYLFAGGVRRAYLDGEKQFLQNYRWSFDFVRWRRSGEAAHHKPEDAAGKPPAADEPAPAP